MTQFDRLERDLATWFSETAVPQTPMFLEDIFQRTARTRQRPRWSFLERYLPMRATMLGASTQGMPWRTLGLLALLVLALVAGLILTTGSPRRLPASFGLARPGLIAFSAGGDIHTVDRATGESRSIVAGPANDINPEWSRDGTKLVFERSLRAGNSLLFVVNGDGTGLTQITPVEVHIDDDVTGADYHFSPDGAEVAFASFAQLQVARTDGSGLRDLSAIAWPGIREVAYRPSEGSQVAAIGIDYSIYLADLAAGTLENLIPVADQAGRRHPRWSPDGSALAYHEWFDAPYFTVRARVYEVQSRVDRLADPTAEGIFWDALPVWSNDGGRLAVLRGYLDGYDDVTAAIVAADGSGLLAETPHDLALIGECCAVFEWAPDDRSILFSRADNQARLVDQRLIDPSTGAVSEVPWSATSDPAWQRLAE